MRMTLSQDLVLLEKRCNNHNGAKYDWKTCPVGCCECPFPEKRCKDITVLDWQKLAISQLEKTTKKPEKKGRGTVLHEAFDVINGQRQDEYGNPEDCFDVIAVFWNEWLRTKIITRYDVAMMMTLLKIARENHLHKEDNIVDACGYLALARDMMEEKAKNDN